MMIKKMPQTTTVSSMEVSEINTAHLTQPPSPGAISNEGRTRALTPDLRSTRSGSRSPGFLPLHLRQQFGAQLCRMKAVSAEMPWPILAALASRSCNGHAVGSDGPMGCEQAGGRIPTCEMRSPMWHQTATPELR
jgi:hypothetical protein